MVSFSVLAVILPLSGALALAGVGGPRFGAFANITLSAIGLVLTLLVWWQAQVGPLSALFGVLSGFTGGVAALANARLVMRDSGHTSPRRWRYEHALFQLFLGLNLLGLYTDNIGLLWLALCGEGVAVALGLSLGNSLNALRAAWISLLWGGVGAGLALLGTLLVYLAAQPVLGGGLMAMSFTALSSHAAHFNQSLLILGFILILFGYGSKISLVWFPGGLTQSHTEGAFYLAYVPQALFANVVLLAILRFRHLLQGEAGAGLAAALMLAFAILSLLHAAFAMPRQGNISRFAGILASLQAAISLFAFGVGGVMGVFGGLLQMLLQSLLKTGLFLALADLTSGRGAQTSFLSLRALAQTNKYNFWAFAVALLALSGLPPSGLFVSEFIIIRQTILSRPFLCLPLSIGLGLCALPVLRRAGGMLFRPVPAENHAQAGKGFSLAFVPLGLMFVLAFAMPDFLTRLLIQAAKLLQ